MSVTIITAPEPTQCDCKSIKIFLAGSIEGDTAERWQDVICNQLTTEYGKADIQLTIFNPRRADYDADAASTADCKYFRDQVEWELSHLRQSDIVVFFIDPATKSAITLLELGLYAPSSYVKKIVYCPLAFWRSGNVDIVCEQYDIPVVRTKPAFFKLLCEKINQQIP